MLRPIFVALPMARDIDADGLMVGYLVALDGIPLDAVTSVVSKLVKGTWAEDVRYCPRPPELAVMCRKEAAWMRERAAPRLALPKAHDFIDLRITQRQRAEELERQGYVLIAEGITRDSFPALAKSRAIPAGSLHLWAIDEVWAPAEVAHLVDIHRVESRKGASMVIDEEMSEEAAERYRRILALKDAPDVTPEQLGYRRKIAAMLPDEAEPPAQRAEEERELEHDIPW